MRPESTVATFICMSPAVAPAPTALKVAISADPATSTEAPPPKPLKRPTSSGIEVIFTLSAAMAPISEPMPMPRMM